LMFGQTKIGQSEPTFLIAEIGNNHNGDINSAKQLVQYAKQSGANAVKFQKRDMRQLYRSGSYSSEDLGSQYTLDLLERFQLNEREFTEIFDHCRAINIQAFCTPFDIPSVSFLEKCGVDGFKVASADFSNWPLLRKIIDTGKPLIISTGMTTEEEIHQTCRFLDQEHARFVLLHCNSAYPAPYKDINLEYLSTLRNLSPFNLVGYSGHERGYHIPVAAVAMGARIIEKHFTDDNSKEGNDHKVSLLPGEFKKMVENIRDLEEAIGSGKKRRLTQGEVLNRETLGKSLVYDVDLRAGHTTKETDFIIRSPGGGVPPSSLENYIGKKLTRDVQRNCLVYQQDFCNFRGGFSNFKFKSPYGIPVRHHDFKKLKNIANLDFVEFHFSYSDLLLDDSEYLNREEMLDFSVHCPELFYQDHLLDLSSLDEAYHAISIDNFQRTIQATRRLKSYFPKTQKPFLISNVGGWSTDTFMAPSEKEQRYGVLSETLAALNDDDFEILIQTMPPFPWHFGGQRYHNLFVDPDEILAFCRDNNFRICLDISHTYLAYNFLKLPFIDTITKLLPITAYLHIVDGRGVDEEGLDIGKGDIDFTQLGRVIRDSNAPIPFIPEIWQGHKNNGEGFTQALHRLSEFL
jgi:sialic acid synthase SpsE/sugar phosphate isomerase/epimerase